jgi:hypothetical protein
VHIRTVYDGQDFDLVCAHPLQSLIQSLIGVDVRKRQCIHEVAELLLGSFGESLFHPGKRDHANDASWIGHKPGPEFA